MKRTPIVHIGFCAALACVYGAGMQGASAPRRVEAGLQGAKERKPARAFQGIPEMPIIAPEARLKMSRTMPHPNRADGQIRTIVDLGSSARRTEMVDARPAATATRTAGRRSSVTGMDTAGNVRVVNTDGHRVLEARDSAQPSGVTVLDQLTSDSSGIGAYCNTPPLVTTFTTSSPRAYLYFDVIGASAGDTVTANIYRPDGTLHESGQWSGFTPGVNGYECFEHWMAVSGAPAASHPGVWSASVFWNNSSTPLFTVNFTIAGANHVTIDSLAQFIAPSNGSTLAAHQAFTWTPGSGADRYWLQIGSCQDCNDILDEDEGLNLSRTLDMPLDGRRIYVSLSSHISGAWYWIEYQFIAPSGDQPIAAQLLTPSNGGTVTDPQTFTWGPGNRVDEYYLWVGSCEECDDILDENEGQNLSRTVNLPEDGRTIYVTLLSLMQGNWFYRDYQFRGPSPVATHQVLVNVTNQLGYALNIFVNGTAVGSVPPFSTAGKDVVVSSLRVSFELVQPVVNNRAIGDAVAGTFDTINQPGGTYNFTVSNVIGQDFYFLPSMDNPTAEPLEVEVNGGLLHENKCYCDVSAFSNNVWVGYYHLYSNSNVRLYRAGSGYTGSYVLFGVDANGNTSPIGPLPQYAESGSGIVRLHVTTAP